MPSLRPHIIPFSTSSPLVWKTRPQPMSRASLPSMARLLLHLLVRRLLLLRTLTVVFVASVLLFGMPGVATVIAAIPISGAAGVAASLRDPVLLSHITPVALYVLGSSIASLLQAVCAGLMRIRIVFVIGSLTQVAVLGISFIVLQLGWGINSVLWTLAICSLLNAAAFILWQAKFIFTRGATYKQPLLPLIRLSLSAWQTNLIQGALLKQISVILLGVFAITAVVGSHQYWLFQPLIPTCGWGQSSACYWLRRCRQCGTCGGIRGK